MEQALSEAVSELEAVDEGGVARRGQEDGGGVARGHGRWKHIRVRPLTNTQHTSRA